MAWFYEIRKLNNTLLKRESGFSTQRKANSQGLTTWRHSEKLSEVTAKIGLLETFGLYTENIVETNALTT